MQLGVIGTAKFGRDSQEQGASQLGQLCVLARLGQMPDQIGERFLQLALVDEASQQQHRLAHGAVCARCIAEHDFRFFEHALGGERPGPADIGLGETFAPLRTRVLLDELFEELDGVFIFFQAQRFGGLLREPLRRNRRRSFS